MESLELNSHTMPTPSLNTFRSVLFKPVSVLFLTVLLHYFYHYYLISHFEFQYLDSLSLAEGLIYETILAVAFFWLINQIIKEATNYFTVSAFATSHHIINILVSSLAKIARAIGFIVIFNQLIQNLNLPAEFRYLLSKGTSVLLIGASGWILYQLINSTEQILLHHYAAKTQNSFAARKMKTQLLILKRIALTLTMILVSGSMLLLFDSVKALGTSVLTTAGFLGLVITFTAQKTLSGVFSGLEIALTQPIKIGDAIIIENEFGIVEEINFRNVVIKLWDWRRLIVPTNFFLEKTFQNWSREETNNLIGTVNLYADYTLPLPELRAELKRILSESSLWDKNVNQIQVSDLQDKVMQLRILASADSPSKAWDLSCEVREKLIAYIAKNYPQCLPVTRSKTFKEI
ncbi:MAG: mechanosensitive ion channel [Tatlockia sp.]|nr:mechanosensitive ion channel [Tatlockia sp.]